MKPTCFHLKPATTKRLPWRKTKTKNTSSTVSAPQKKIELEYPEKEPQSYSKFKYSFYFRGGGKMNEGMDINFVSFTQGEYKYVLYSTYYALDEKSEIGIKVIHLKTNKTTLIKGQLKSQKGSLIDFRYNNLLSIDDQLYE